MLWRPQSSTPGPNASVWPALCRHRLPQQFSLCGLGLCRLAHYLADKKKNEKAVVEMAGKLTQQLGGGGGGAGAAGRTAASRAATDEGLKAVVAAYEQKQAELAKDNRDFKASLAALQVGLNVVLPPASRQLVRREGLPGVRCACRGMDPAWAVLLLVDGQLEPMRAWAWAIDSAVGRASPPFFCLLPSAVRRCACLPAHLPTC